MGERESEGNVVKTVMVGARIPEPLFNAFEARCDEEHRSKSATLRLLIRRYLSSHEEAA